MEDTPTSVTETLSVPVPVEFPLVSDVFARASTQPTCGSIMTLLIL